MREILFRAKREVTNEWVYGYFVNEYDDFQIYVQPQIITRSGREYVNKNTLGQFTGLNDKNGTKIFEGDIVEYTTKLSRNTEEIVNVYEIKYSKEQARFIAFLPNGVFDPVAMRYGKVIGNIYDNPELIGGTDDENNH